MRLSARMGIAAFLVMFVMMLSSSAWAAPQVDLYHSVMVSANKDKGAADYSNPPKEWGLDAQVFHSVTVPMGTSSGEIKFNFKNAVTVEDDRTGKQEIRAAGAHTFKLWPEGTGLYAGHYSKPGDDKGNIIYFRDGAERALSGSSFTVTSMDEVVSLDMEVSHDFITNTNMLVSKDNGAKRKVTEDVTKTFPPIQTAAYQFDTSKRVPYIELEVDSGKNVKGVKWRFVDPANVDVPLKAAKDDGLILIGITIRPLNGGSVQYRFAGPQNVLLPAVGSDLAGYEEITPISFDNLREARLMFVNPGGMIDEPGGFRVTVFENWRFRFNSDGSENISGEIVSSADLAAVKRVTDSSLTNPPAKIVTLDEENGGKILTGTQAIASNGKIDAWRTSSVISVEQEVSEGGALAFSHELGFALTDKSLKDEDMPGIPDNLTDLKEKYSVLKHFEEAGAVDLLEQFGDKGIFAIEGSEEKKVMLKATLIIIDDAAPKNEPDLKTYYNGKYGIKFVDGGSDGKYLYIWDGERNGKASDPIALTAKDTQKNSNNQADSGKSGGCDAGAGMIGLLFAGWAALKYRKRA